MNWLLPCVLVLLTTLANAQYGQQQQPSSYRTASRMVPDQPVSSGYGNGVSGLGSSLSSGQNQQRSFGQIGGVVQQQQQDQSSGYGSSSVPVQQDQPLPVSSGYGSTQVPMTQDQPQPVQNGYGSSAGIGSSSFGQGSIAQSQRSLGQFGSGLVQQQQQQPQDQSQSISNGYGSSSSVNLGQNQRSFGQIGGGMVQDQSQPISSGGYGSSSSSRILTSPYQQMLIQQRSSPMLSQGYGQSPMIQSFNLMRRPMMMRMLGDIQQPQQPIQVQLTQADILCQGKFVGQIIPLEDQHRFVTCLADGKGVEQVCPANLYYNPEALRCERRVRDLPPPCSSQPCLNGGQCSELSVSTYQCQCPDGFEGPQCERDVRSCAGQPCGEGVCQGFRYGSALPYVCLCPGNSYGSDCQRPIASPCTNDEKLPLAFSDKGFIMCDGERFFVETCAGGLVWDDSQKTCTWPGQIGGVQQPIQDQPQGSYGSSQGSYGSQQQPTSSYGGYSQQQQQPLQQTVQPMISRQFDQQQSSQLPQASSYGSYGQQQGVSSGGLQQQDSSYGSQVQVQQPTISRDLPTSSYGSSSYSQQQSVQPTGTMTSQFDQQQQPLLRQRVRHQKRPNRLFADQSSMFSGSSGSQQVQPQQQQQLTSSY